MSGAGARTTVGELSLLGPSRADRHTGRDQIRLDAPVQSGSSGGGAGDGTFGRASVSTRCGGPHCQDVLRCPGGRDAVRATGAQVACGEEY